MGSNRTFMELKRRTMSIEACKQPRSNRTFMELKRPSLMGKCQQAGVLIVPLWN